MVELAIKENVSRVELARKDNEGLLLALAALSHMFPKLSDAELLIDIAKKSRRLHVKYRIVMAFGRAIERGYAHGTQLEVIRTLLEQFKAGADQHLLERINYTAERYFPDLS